MRAVRIAWLVGIGGVLVVASCFVQGFELTTSTTTTTPDGGTGGSTGGESTGGSAGGGGTDPCDHATWPSPPTSVPPDPDTVEFVAAFRSVNFGEEFGAEGPTMGYDLDYRCTCQGQGSSCRVPDWATGTDCDGPEGRDNAAARLFAILGPFVPSMGSDVTSEQAANGQWSILVSVREYNGASNDDQVVVSLFPSPGFDKDPCNPAGSTPDWLGDDRWPVGAESLHGYGGYAGNPAGGGGGESPVVGGCGGAPGFDIEDAVAVDANAYVTDGILVASLPEVGLPIVTDEGIARLIITAGFVTARLEHQAATDQWALRQGLLVGRWQLSHFFGLLGSIQSSGQFLCTDHPLYPAVKTAVCRFPDISATLSGPTSPCDSISMGISFEAEAVRLGAVYRRSVDPSACPSVTDPAGDDCSTEPGG